MSKTGEFFKNTAAIVGAGWLVYHATAHLLRKSDSEEPRCKEAKEDFIEKDTVSRSAVAEMIKCRTTGMERQFLLNALEEVPSAYSNTQHIRCSGL